MNSPPRLQIFTLILFGLIFLLTGCIVEEPATLPASSESSPDYQQEMRAFVRDISQYAKSSRADFIIIPQNGAELISATGEDTGPPDVNYLGAIDGIGQESLYYGYYDDDQETPPEERAWTRTFLDLAKEHGNVVVLVTDYCSTRSHVDSSYTQNDSSGYVSFAADHRELDNIPAYPTSPGGENDAVITKLSQVENFLYLINPQAFSSRQAFVEAVSATNYDLLIMDFFFDGETYTPDQLAQIREKENGGKRLMIAYLSIGEAEDYRYYWQEDWRVGSPAWLVEENPHWPGNYRVEYWNPAWQRIIYGDDSSYLDKIIKAGFDGVYLDIIDAFEYFED